MTTDKLKMLVFMQSSITMKWRLEKGEIKLQSKCWLKMKRHWLKNEVFLIFYFYLKNIHEFKRNMGQMLYEVPKSILNAIAPFEYGFQFYSGNLLREYGHIVNTICLLHNPEPSYSLHLAKMQVLVGDRISDVSQIYSFLGHQWFIL